MDTGSKYAVAKHVREKKKPRAVKVNSRDQLGWNPVTLAALDGTVAMKSDFIAFEELSQTQIAVDPVEEGTPGCVPLQRSKSEKTATSGPGPILALHPELKVEVGRQRLIPWMIDPNSHRFILLLDKEENIPAPKKGTQKLPDSTTHPADM